MIEGRVARLATIPLVVRGFNEQEAVIEATIDTGFSAGISLTADTIAMLNLPFAGDVPIQLADGQEYLVPTYTVIVEWDGIERLVIVVGVDPQPLVGMGLMAGYNLSVDVQEGGPVRLSRLGGELQTVQSDLESST